MTKQGDRHINGAVVRGRQTFALVHPVEHQDKTYAELSVRRAKVKDLIAAERQPGEIGREAALLAICAGVDFAVVGEMDVSDYHSIVTRTGIDFLSQAGPAAAPGGASSSSTAGPAGD